jgi:hypothetical protein
MFRGSRADNDKFTHPRLKTHRTLPLLPPSPCLYGMFRGDICLLSSIYIFGWHIYIYILVTYVKPTSLLKRYTCHWTRYTRKRLGIKHAVVYKQLLALSGFASYALVAGQRPQMHILEGGVFPTGEASSSSFHGSRFYHTWSYNSRSLWPHGLRLGVVAVTFLGLWVRIPMGTCLSVPCQFCVCVVRYRSLRRSDPSSWRVLPSVSVIRCTCSLLHLRSR